MVSSQHELSAEKNQSDLNNWVPVHMLAHLSLAFKSSLIFIRPFVCQAAGPLLVWWCTPYMYELRAINTLSSKFRFLQTLHMGHYFNYTMVILAPSLTNTFPIWSKLSWSVLLLIQFHIYIAPLTVICNAILQNREFTSRCETNAYHLLIYGKAQCQVGASIEFASRYSIATA